MPACEYKARPALRCSRSGVVTGRLLWVGLTFQSGDGRQSAKANSHTGAGADELVRVVRCLVKLALVGVNPVQQPGQIHTI